MKRRGRDIEESVLPSGQFNQMSPQDTVTQRIGSLKKQSRSIVICQVLSCIPHPSTLCFRKHQANKLAGQTAELYFKSFMASSLSFSPGVWACGGVGWSKYQVTIFHTDMRPRLQHCTGNQKYNEKRRAKPLVHRVQALEAPRRL